MNYIIALAVVFFIIWLIRGSLKMMRWNRDQDQQILVGLLIDAANGDPEPASTFLANKNWPPTEATRRLMHASTVIDRLDQPAAIKTKAYEIAKQLAIAS
jgi:hypothetical protein